jgi:hypothetical protein
MYPYTITSETITVTIDGVPHNMTSGDPKFGKLRDAIFDSNWTEVKSLAAPGLQVQSWSQGNFSYDHGTLTYKGEQIPPELYAKMVAAAKSGKRPDNLMNFFERLRQNPSYRSVSQLFRFLEHANIPLDKDGFILAYKGVRKDFKDQHSGKFTNTVGSVMRMDRNKVSDDPREACHEGFHVGDLSYASGFGPRVVICSVDPKDVVSIPYDSSSRKMRVCEYKVIGLYGSPLPDLIADDEDLELPPEDEEEGEEEVPEDEEEDAEAGPEESEEEIKLPKSVGAGAANGLEHLTLEALRKYAKEKGVKNVKAVAGGKAGLLKLLKSLGELVVGEHQVTVGPAPEKVQDMSKFEAMNIGDLRKYASHELKIVGASKIPGGKQALLDVIKGLVS